MNQQDISRTRILALCEKEHITQKSLAVIIGVDPTRITRIKNAENGAFFTLDQLCRIADYFNVSLDYLVGRQDENGVTRKAPENVSLSDILQMLDMLNDAAPFEININENGVPMLLFKSNSINEMMLEWHGFRSLPDGTAKNKAMELWEKEFISTHNKALMKYGFKTELQYGAWIAEQLIKKYPSGESEGIDEYGQVVDYYFGAPPDQRFEWHKANRKRPLNDLERDAFAAFLDSKNNKLGKYEITNNDFEFLHYVLENGYPSDHFCPPPDNEANEEEND